MTGQSVLSILGARMQVQPAMARDLFPAGFVSCWSELDEGMQEALIRSLEAALASPSIPKDIVTTLLNLAEFMEHDEKSLPLGYQVRASFGTIQSPHVGQACTEYCWLPRQGPCNKKDCCVDIAPLHSVQRLKRA